jgi:predicted phage terminase large subunit-like protein
MNNEELLALRAALRADLRVFAHKTFRTLEPATPFRENWHLDTFGYHLERVARGECRRLIINVPPRSMKSIYASVAFPAWLLGRDPSKKVMCVSYGHDLTRKHSLDFRTIVESDWYRRLFPSFGMERRRQRNSEITTAANGYRFASAMGGGLLGRGADFIIIDDPIKPQDAASEALRRHANELYDSSIYTRLNEKTEGSIVIVMQRLHDDDLVGHVLEKEDWEVVAIPAIEIEDRDYRTGPLPNNVYFRRAGEVLHPEREPREILDLLRRNLGSLSFSAQYQQQPLPLEGNYLKRQWLRYYDQAPAEFDLVMASWDTASTDNENSDYSVCTVWGLHDQEVYLLDVVRERLEMPDLRRLIEVTHQQWQAAATLIEDTDVGRAIGQDLRRSSPIVKPIMWPIKYDKEARFLAQSPKFESGQVLLPREASWLSTYIGELLAFPNGRHDDQVDSTAHALHWRTSRLAQQVPPIRPTRSRPTAPSRQPTRRTRRLVDYSQPF